MKNTQPHIHQDKTQTSKFPKLQPLKLEQLEGWAGGVRSENGTVECPVCVAA